MRKIILSILVATSLVVAIAFAQLPSNSMSAAQLREAFAHPPDDARIMMRWWWFGSAVTEQELARELRVMKAAGVGGVEIQPVYPVALDDPAHQFKNLPYISGEFLDRVRFTSQQARELGLRVDVTLGSGWPYGGPHTPVTLAAGKLRYEQAVVPSGASSVALPDMENGETLLAAFLAEGFRTHLSNKPMERVTQMEQNRLQLPAGLTGPHVALFFIASRTGQQVKRAAVGAEGFVLDHYNREAITQHLNDVGNKLLQAFGSHPPYSVFSDSLEVYGSDWTTDFLAEFQKRRGYDLTPYLPALVEDIGEKTKFVRHDWGKTLTELAEERYLTPIREWAHSHNTKFRSQTYGTPPVVLSSNRLVDLAEGEHGPIWRTFSTARWASSANHLYARPVTSTETWTWLHSPSFRATPLDMKAEADLHFIQGINQLVGHGWPYSPPSVAEPGWRFYAAGALNEHNPWFGVMPDLTAYLQRMSFLMRQGTPANDIAVYIPTDDAWSAFKPGNTSVNEEADKLIGQKLIPEILNAGYNFDFIDDGAIASVGVPYRILILPGVEQMPPATLEKLQGWVRQGGKLIATRRVPTVAPGLMATDKDTPRLQQLTQALFEGADRPATVVGNEQNLGEALTKMLPPDMAVSPEAASALGFIHRKTGIGDLFFVANTSNQPVKTEARFRIEASSGAEWWDPFTGKTKPAISANRNGNAAVMLDLAPYESRVVFFSNEHSAPANAAAQQATANEATLDLSTQWKLTFAGESKSEDVQDLRSWTEDNTRHFYSGKGTYEKTFDVPDSLLQQGREVMLDFGSGTPVQRIVRPGPGMRAWIESPVRESAVVYINGKLAGYVWHPPYRVSVGALLHAGKNECRVVVGNSAINTLAGQTPPSYHLLDLEYGNRFTPQDMENLQPLPSGMLGPVRLIAE
jgi:hypothetical protein